MASYSTVTFTVSGYYLISRDDEFSGSVFAAAVGEVTDSTEHENDGM